MFPNSYANRPLSHFVSGGQPNTFLPEKAAIKARPAGKVYRAVFSGTACRHAARTAHLPPQIGNCSGCGGHSSELKFCARCRTAKYCSRACQVCVGGMAWSLPAVVCGNHGRPSGACWAVGWQQHS